ncbi:MAG TPA: hypothetical protein PKH24_13770 [Sedimentisphaerales bacterium]|jgi:hypothetical protein|nr:hypothetical protein [Sedimentisphaerales bacterium]HNU28900.1 hypothetical protein [Sedimentisphaerales bacterium]
MKRFSGVFVICLLAAGVAAAVPTVKVDRVAGTYPLPKLGGEFLLTPNAELAALLGSSQPFESFCLEINEYAWDGSTYQAAVNTEAIAGGGVGPGETAGADPISPETAYLYTQFRAGILSGYVYTIGSEREASAKSLQEAIWYFEHEDGYTDLSLLSAKAQGFVAEAQEADWSTIGNVRVLNLTRYGQPAQDLLAMVVPAPGAVFLCGIALPAIAWLKRRKTM